MNINILEMSLIWEDTVEHPFNDFGEETSQKNNNDYAYATTLALVRKLTLLELIQRVIRVSRSYENYAENPNLLSGFILAISCISSFPLNLKYIKNDDIANMFLSSIDKDSEGARFIPESVLLEYSDLKYIINYYEEKKLISKVNERYYINAFVLNSVDLK